MEFERFKPTTKVHYMNVCHCSTESDRNFQLIQLKLNINKVNTYLLQHREMNVNETSIARQKNPTFGLMFPRYRLVVTASLSYV